MKENERKKKENERKRKKMKERKKKIKKNLENRNLAYKIAYLTVCVR